MTEPPRRRSTQDERWFQTTVIVSLYKQEGWPEKQALFVNFDLATATNTPELPPASTPSWWPDEIVDSFAWGDRDQRPTNPGLAAAGYSHTVVQPPYEWGP